jgi:DNA-directed RNA polymerase subunit N (RpoN/RPB10)
MIIPVRCFTCAKVLADKWEYYVRRCKELEELQKEKQKSTATDNKDDKKDVELNEQHYDKVIRQKVFEELGLDRICCRRMMLGHVDLIEII